jgi:hypothetical protein
VGRTADWTDPYAWSIYERFQAKSRKFRPWPGPEALIATESLLLAQRTSMQVIGLGGRDVAADSSAGLASALFVIGVSTAGL